MISLDVRTVFASSIILTTLCVLVTGSLWNRNRARSPEIVLWLLNSIMQLAALVLFALRGAVPDFLSVIVANAMLIGGTMLLYIGLERYVGRRSRQWHNGVLLVAYLAIHAYFTFLHPSLAARNVNSSVALILITSQCAWLLLRRAPREMRLFTRDPGIVFVALVVVSTFRIPFDLTTAGQDLLQEGLPGALAVILMHMLFVALTFSLLLMVNRRLVMALEQDIIERERAQEALRLSEEKFSIAFENIPDAIVLTAADTGQIIEVNQGFARVSGHTKAEARGTNTLALGLWVDPVQRAEMVAAVRRDGRVTDFAAKFRNKSGESLDALVSSQLMMVDGEACILTMIRDETERVRALAALELSEMKFATAFRTSPDSVNINRLVDGAYIDVNEGFTRLTQYTPEDVAGRTSRDIEIWVDPGDRDRLVRGLLADGVVHNLEAQYRRKDGSVTTALMSAQLIEVDGESCILSVTRDISDRKRTEIELKKSEERFRVLAENTTDIAWEQDAEMRMTYISDADRRLRGFSRDEVLGRDSMELFTPEGQATIREVMARRREVESRGEVRQTLFFQAPQVCKDGGQVWVEVATTPIYDNKGTITGYTGITRDISARKRAEDEILRLNAELEERVEQRTQELQAALEDVSQANEVLTEMNLRLEQATSAKSDFLAAMSHELRTPLNSIIGFSDLLGRGMVGDLSEEQGKQIQMINTSGKYLLELVNEVLDLSAIEVGQLRIESRPLSAIHLSRAVVDSLQPLALERGLELTWDVALDADALESDRTRLEQILFNLLGNAIKFTDAGSVQLTVSREGSDVLFVISDTGRGIAEDELGRVFEEFYQTERRDIAKTEGTGLGLTVSRRLAEMLGGSIEVESVIGQGSTFTVRLPARPEHDA